MKEITIEFLKERAESLLFTMSEEGLELLHNEFDMLILQMKALDKIVGIAEAKEMIFPYLVYATSMREDEAKDSLPVQEMLKNSGKTFANQIVVPKVVL